MPFRKSPSMDRTGVQRMAQGWGKIVARRVHEEVGPDRDLDAEDIEQMAATAACAMAKGAIEELLEKKAALRGAEQPCPSCKRLCPVHREPFISGEAKSPTQNPSVTARPVAGIFFPQHPGLRFTPHNSSPSVLGKILRSSAREPSFQEATAALEELAEVTISSRQVGRIAQELGQQLQVQRDDHVEQFQAHTLQPRVETHPALAVVEVDGGRLQVRGGEMVPGPMTRRGVKTRSRCWPRRQSPFRTRIPSRTCRTGTAIENTWRNWSAE